MTQAEKNTRKSTQDNSQNSAKNNAQNPPQAPSKKASVDFDEIRVVFKNMTSLYASGEHELPLPANLSAALEAKAYWLSRCYVQAGKHALDNAKMVLFHANTDIEGTENNTSESNKINSLREGLIEGETALNYLCQSMNCSLQLYELDPDTPVHIADEKSAMDVQEAAMALTYGMMSVEQQTECLLAQSFGQNLGKASAKLIHFARKNTPSAQNTHQNQNFSGDSVNKGEVGHNHLYGFELLAHKGTRELAALCGAVIAARLSGIPVILQGTAGLACMHILAGESLSAISHCYWIPCAEDEMLGDAASPTLQSTPHEWPCYTAQAAQIPNVEGADMLDHYGHLKVLAALLKAHHKDAVPSAAAKTEA